MMRMLVIPTSCSRAAAKQAAKAAADDHHVEFFLQRRAREARLDVGVLIVVRVLAGDFLVLVVCVRAQTLRALGGVLLRAGQPGRSPALRESEFRSVWIALQLSLIALALLLGAASTLRPVGCENSRTASYRSPVFRSLPQRVRRPASASILGGRPSQRMALHAASMKAKRRGPPCCDPRSFAAGSPGSM